MEALAPLIRSIPDFPEPGVVFRDITPLLRDHGALASATAALCAPFEHGEVNVVAGMEARGFIFGALVAQALGVGFVPLRKPGKLPHLVESVDYTLEYGTTGLEVHSDALDESARVLIVDDVLATGGTAGASRELVRRLGADVVGCSFLIELEGLRGREQLQGCQVHSVLTF
ncbi:MAG: adenine phosphoribosyltransferase [Pseudomonadota bacterium]